MTNPALVRPITGSIMLPSNRVLMFLVAIVSITSEWQTISMVSVYKTPKWSFSGNKPLPIFSVVLLQEIPKIAKALKISALNKKL